MMARDDGRGGISRRTLLIGGGVGAGLLVAWGLWPRSYPAPLQAGKGESIFNAFLKIGNDGRIVVAVPQLETGQGVYTALPQIIADELGADWRTIAVEPAPVANPYANDLLAGAWSGAAVPAAVRMAGDWPVREYAMREAMMLTGGSTSVRGFAPRLRQAGAAARALLMKAAAERWGADWEGLDTAAGFVVAGARKLAFGELAEAAATLDLPEPLPVRGGLDNRLTGKPLPRLDAPSKVDGSARFAGDIRLPDMLYASARAGPIGDSRLVQVDAEAADAVPGVLAIFENARWAAVAATDWWAADRALNAMKPVFETRGGLIDDGAIEAALAAALEEGDARRLAEVGEADAALAGGPLYRAHYDAGPIPNAALETLAVTARWEGGRLEIWAASQAPAHARRAAARAAGIAESQVTLYTTLAGGGYGRKFELDAIAQAAAMAMQLKRPVQLVWSRFEESVQDRFRPPVRAALTARMERDGRIAAWSARIAAPALLPQLFARLKGEAASTAAAAADAGAVEGALPPYAIAAKAVDHVPVPLALEPGVWRGGAHAYTAFFTECFIDELARRAGIEPLSFRMQMLGENPRLAQVLTTAAALAGWDGGGPGSAMGIAAHSAFGSHVATVAEVEIDKNQRVRVTRAVAAVDCGRVVNPELVRQQIEGAILHAIGGATGSPIAFEGGLPSARRLGAYGLPRLADAPDITVEIASSDEPPGGVTELGVPTVAPAIANALFAATGQRLRALPLIPGSVA